MARPLRVNFKNGWYHVTARGINRQRIYCDERNRRHFLERHGVQVHAYVLMDNHYHLLVRTPQANLSAALQWLNVAYSIWWNRRHDRVGPVFQGRFKAVVVEPGQWVLEEALGHNSNGVWRWAGRPLPGRCGRRPSSTGRAAVGGRSGRSGPGPRWYGPSRRLVGKGGRSLRGGTATRGGRWRCMWRGAAPD